jgi:L-2,4-diaminobutyrate transaminase
MLAALEFVEDKASRRLFATPGKVGGAVAAACFERGVIGRAMPHGDILGFAPPLTLSRGEADRIVAATKGAIEAVYANL